MKKLFAAMLLTASLLCAGCSASESSATAKSNLEASGYKVEVYSETEAKARIEGLKFVVSFNDAVYAKKGDKGIFLGFFCKNIDDASKFTEENIRAMYNWGTEYTEEPKVGTRNNVSYVGDAAAIAALGYAA